MRIDKNFDLVSCFNDRVKAPVQTGSSNGVLLDKHEDVSGDYLISRLNESIFGSTEGHHLRLYLQEGNPYDGVYLNHDGMSEGQAMEELMKKSTSMVRKSKKNTRETTTEKRCTGLLKELCIKE